jgi:hypothetical protein
MILKQILKGLRDSRDTFLYTLHPISTGKARDVTAATLLFLWSILLSPEVISTKLVFYSTPTFFSYR